MRRGGSYEVQKDGEIRRIAGTVDHPTVNGPRDADGRLIVDGVAAPPEAVTAAATPVPEIPAKPAAKKAG